MIMLRRLALLALITVALAPGTWLRSPRPVADYRNILLLEPLPLPQARIGEVEITGLWRLTSPNVMFAGYSGLAVLPSGELLAVSDRGSWLRFDPPGVQAAPPHFAPLPRVRQGDTRQVDAEAVTLDPNSGQVWVAYEDVNSIERSSPSFTDPQVARPQEMRNWRGNSGPEAMERLPDGRFLVIGEGRRQLLGGGFPALLFARDPVEGARSLESTFLAPAGYHPTDIATLPDGRVLILLRRVISYFPQSFSAKLVVADQARIRVGTEWGGRVIATIAGDMPRDNFEGLAAVQRSDGGYTLWLISDDNGSAFQKTLLYRLEWNSAAARTAR